MWSPTILQAKGIANNDLSERVQRAIHDWLADLAEAVKVQRDGIMPELSGRFIPDIESSAV
ncbi:MAG: hypothetical protein HQM09_22850 [Candidatus Riflebacteria bacterium]|nr:hypothetical protein [Candidatus Riflebacteria bacterium]